MRLPPHLSRHIHLLSLGIALLLPLTTADLSSPSSPSLPKTLTLSFWPLSSPSPAPLAIISYDPSTFSAQISSYTPPSPPSSTQLNPDEDEAPLIRIGFPRPDLPSHPWIGPATSLLSFAPDAHKRFTLYLDEQGEVWHVGFAAWRPTSTLKGQGSAHGGTQQEGNVTAVLATHTPGPTPVLETRTVVLDREGRVVVQGKEGGEKTFFQKYWWVLVGVLLVQLVVGGGGKE